MMLNIALLKEQINNYIETYNKYNNNDILDYIGSLCILILKLLSFNLYVLLSDENRELFNNNLLNLYILISKLYDSFKEKENVKKSQKRRCR